VRIDRKRRKFWFSFVTPVYRGEYAREIDANTTTLDFSSFVGSDT